MSRRLALACFVVLGCMPSRTSSASMEQRDARPVPSAAQSAEHATNAVRASDAPVSESRDSSSVAGATTAKPAEAEPTTLDALFAPSASEVTELRDWGDAIVVRMGAWYEVDLERARLVSFESPAGADVLTEAWRAAHPQVLVSEADGGISVQTRIAGDWKREALPRSDEHRSYWPLVLASTRESTVVLVGEVAFLSSSDGWRTVPVDAGSLATSNHQVRDPLRESSSALWCFAANRLWRSNSFGEWGSVLNALDLATGTWSEPIAGFRRLELANPRSLHVDPRGQLWMVSSLAHLALIQGSLWRWTGTGWSVDTAVEGLNAWELDDPNADRVPAVLPTRRVPPERIEGGWSLGTTTFEALAFDADGRPCLATREFGLVRRDAKGAWKQLTPDWRPVIEIVGLGVHGSTAVIATWKNGVLLCDLETGRLRRCE